MRTRLAPWAALIAVAVTAAGCGDTHATSASPDSTTTTAAAGVAAAAELDWEGCAHDPLYDCATLEVPLDHTDPTGESIELALIRREADSADPAGNLVWNPGGPGGSAVDSTPHMGDFAGLGEHFHLIGMDPRGVGGSTPVSCDTTILDDIFAEHPTPDGTDTTTDELADHYDAFAASCAERSGDLLDHVGTLDVVEDLELLRRALGDDELNFLGLSYGTYLGGAYAERYPQHVGRFVLDGAIGPDVDGVDVIAGQAESLDRAIAAFLDACDGSDWCALADQGDPHEVYLGLLDRLGDTPLESDGRRAGAHTLLAAVGPLAIGGEDAWGTLDAVLTSAAVGDASVVLAVADQTTGRNPDGTYTSTIGSEAAVACLDPIFPTTAEAIAEIDDRIAAATYALGPIEFGWRSCPDWPVEERERPAPYRAEGSNPILVIGTTGDPSTPYEWAETMDHHLDNSVLLTMEGEGHTAFGRDDCIDDAVETYFLDGTLPAAGTVCGQ